MKLQTKITIVLLIVSLSTITYLSSIFTRKMLNAQLQELRQNLSGLAAAASLLIDGDKHELLKSSADITTSNYQEIYQKLLELKRYHPKIRYVYTMRPTKVENIYEFIECAGV